MNNHWQSIALIVLCLWAIGCANMVPPSGGDKDVTPPQIVISEPPSFTTNFTGNQIEIQFDEFVALSNPSREFIFSPPLAKEPDIKLRGKRVSITFKDTLKSNTTYSIDFGLAIKDITEGNALGDYYYVFSTGGHIDSLNMAGKVRDMVSGDYKENVWVLVFDQAGDSAVYRENPSYIARTDKEGIFSVDYMASGNYSVYALIDQNANRRYDLPNEQIAFLDALVSPLEGDTATLVELNLFAEDRSQLQLLTHNSDHPGKLDFVFSGTVRAPVIESEPAGIIYSKEWSEQRDSLSIYLNRIDLDSAKFYIWANDEFRDTADFVFKYRDTTLYLLKTGTNINKNGTLDVFSTLHLKINYPLEGIDSSGIQLFLIEDSVPEPLTIKPRFQDEKLATDLVIDYPWQDTATYKLLIIDSALKTIHGQWNDSIQYNFSTTNSADYANLTVHFTELDTSIGYIVELETNKKLVKKGYVPREKMSTALKFENLKPGQYLLKIVEDRNLNKRWDTGKLLERRQPERIIRSSIIEIKQGWDNESTFDMSTF